MTTPATTGTGGEGPSQEGCHEGEDYKHVFLVLLILFYKSSIFMFFLEVFFQILLGNDNNGEPCNILDHYFLCAKSFATCFELSNLFFFWNQRFPKIKKYKIMFL